MLNGNFVPDCDLMSGAAQDLRPTGGDFCGQWQNPNFGKAVDASGNPIYSLGYDEKILKGWGTRPSDWQIGVTLQHEVLPRVSLEVGYTRRWLQNFTVTDNLAVECLATSTRSASSPPLTLRLPNGGGYTVTGLYNVKPDKFSVAPNNLRTYAPDYGTIAQKVQRRGHQHERPAHQRTPAAGRHHDRAARHGLLRGAGPAPRADRRLLDGSEVSGYSPVNPYVTSNRGSPRGLPPPAPIWCPRSTSSCRQRSRARRLSPSRRTGRCRAPSSRRDARAAAVRQRAERHGQPARTGPDACATGQSAGPAIRESVAVRHAPRDRVGRHVQRAERRHHTYFQPELHAGRRVARPEQRTTARTTKITVKYDF